MIETALREVIDRLSAPPAPPRLARAVRHAVFPGGARIRPNLCLAVFRAAQADVLPTLCQAQVRAEGEDLALSAAVALELLHCASLVHDDLPCFDDAVLRRGQPSVHAKFGEPTAVLVGDGLIVAAFDVVGAAMASDHPRRMEVFKAVTGSVGLPGGIVAGQGWECEAPQDVDLAAYHASKTGALFTAACLAGAAAAGGDIERWHGFGRRIGHAYQIADDLKDCLLAEAELGKPAGQDVRHDRPSAVHELGVEGAQLLLAEHLCQAMAIVGEGIAGRPLQSLLGKIAAKVLPPDLAELKVAVPNPGRDRDSLEANRAAAVAV